MNLTTLICPQCGAPLPRQALWRMVVCAYCLAEVTRASNIVQAATFKQAYLRSRSDTGNLRFNDEYYQTMRLLGHGEHTRVHLAQRLGAAPEYVVVKLAQEDASAGRLRQEAKILTQLQALTLQGAAYFSQRLPQPIACGTAEEVDGQRRPALLLRHPAGFWGSLADVSHRYQQGVDARHVVWMWRRVLDVLGYIHAAGWTHGRLSLDHMLVQPDDHGVLLIGWAGARQRGNAAADLMQSAWAMRSLLDGGDGEPPVPAATPAPLATLLRRASEDRDWCAYMGAAGIDTALQAAAREAFGAPQFISFTPTNHR